MIAKIVEIVEQSKFLLDFQKEALLHIVKGIKEEDTEESAKEDTEKIYVDWLYDIIDTVFYKLLGKRINDLSAMEQLEIKYVIQDVTDG